MKDTSTEINELRKFQQSMTAALPELGQELEKLVRSDDDVVLLLYSRRCLEVMVTELCRREGLKFTQSFPLKGMIDKIQKEEKAPPSIVTAMQNLNSSSVYGAHPKEFDSGQVRTALINLSSVLEWFAKYLGIEIDQTKVVSVQNIISSGQEKTQKKSILVLPFENMSPDPDQEYFSDGLTEEIITDLSHINDLLVISRSSAMTFKGSKKKIADIAREVNVHYVLEGSVRKAGLKLRITAQLIDAITDTHLWAEKYDGTLDDIFEIQEKVAQSIFQALKIKLSENDLKILEEIAGKDVSVFEYYHKSMYAIWTHDEKNILKAINLLDEAIKKVGEDPLFYSAKAWAYWIMVNAGMREIDTLELAENELEKALTIKPNFARALAIYGWIYLLREGIVKKSVNYLNKAITIDPNDYLALQGLVIAYSFIGKTKVAENLFQQLEQINPLDPNTVWCKGAIPFYYGNFQDALLGFAQHAKIMPVDFPYFIFLARIYTDNRNELAELVKPYVKDEPNLIFEFLTNVLYYALTDDKLKLETSFTENFLTACERDVTNAQYITTTFALAGIKEQTYKWLEIAINKGYINYPMIAEKDTLLEFIRHEERFKIIVDKVKNEWENFKV